jgi:hypothetical protein
MPIPRPLSCILLFSSLLQQTTLVLPARATKWLSSLLDTPFNPNLTPIRIETELCAIRIRMLERHHFISPFSVIFGNTIRLKLELFSL